MLRFDCQFDTLNYELDRPLPKGKRNIGLMKAELVRKFMAKFVRLKAKTYSGLEPKKQKAQKSVS